MTRTYDPSNERHTVKRLLVLVAVTAGATFGMVPSASAQICLRVLCDDRPITGCYDTGDMRFCI